MRTARFSFVVWIFLLAAPLVRAQAMIPEPWNGYQSFWNNPEAIRSLKLTNEQRQALNHLLTTANNQLQAEIQGLLTREQQKKIRSLRINHASDASLMGLNGPDAQKIAPAVRIRRVAAQSYLTLINLLLVKAADAGGQALQVSRTLTNDPCKVASEAVAAAAPNLDSRLLKFSFILDGAHFEGPTCPDESASMRPGRPSTLIATYPCAVTTNGVDLAPGCKFTASVVEYQY